jgi:3D-(3,5/4)-trihydroxycyclohexane-1,2-dione acylhydrolase (decyclizing)
MHGNNPSPIKRPREVNAMTTVKLTAAQYCTRFLAAQRTEIGGRPVPIFGGVWAIFGHGNVAGLGEALYEARETLPTYRSHNEQAMALAACAFAKASRRRRMMAATTSIGPGATNMVTAAAVAHVNRLPLLLLPGDVFASRRPDPVLQQIEDFGDGTVSANDCFRPVSRYFDRITRAEQIVPALDRAMAVLTDPTDCGPVTLAFCQDVQTEALEVPARLLEPRLWTPRRQRPDKTELDAAIAAIRAAQRPLIIAGGGVLYSEAEEALSLFAARHCVPVAETQAGKSAIPIGHALNLGSIGVTGTSAANDAAAEADLIIAVGTRLQDFTTASWALFQGTGRKLLAINVCAFDAGKHRAQILLGDARETVEELGLALMGWAAPAEWTARAKAARQRWDETAARYTAPSNAALPSDAQVIGAVQRQSQQHDVVVCAAGGLPGELHKHWHAGAPGGYHLEYGYSCMGYEIAGGLGVKMADPARDVFVMVGDGSYLMMNSEIATSVLLGMKLTIVVLDNRGFGCIDRLQRSVGVESFNNLLAATRHKALPEVDFAAHARSLGAHAEKVAGIGELETALARARQADRTSVIVIDTDPALSTDAGGFWWDVAVPEVSHRGEVRAARAAYDSARGAQRLGD